MDDIVFDNKGRLIIKHSHDEAFYESLKQMENLPKVAMFEGGWFLVPQGKGTKILESLGFGEIYQTPYEEYPEFVVVIKGEGDYQDWGSERIDWAEHGEAIKGIIQKLARILIHTGQDKNGVVRDLNKIETDLDLLVFEHRMRHRRHMLFIGVMGITHDNRVPRHKAALEYFQEIIEDALATEVEQRFNNQNPEATARAEQKIEELRRQFNQDMQAACDMKRKIEDSKLSKGQIKAALFKELNLEGETE